MKIRKATSEDSFAVAECLFLAMEGIIYAFTGAEDREKAMAFMLHFVSADNNQYSYQNCWVAEDEGEIVGAVTLYDGADLRKLREPVAHYVRSVYGVPFEPEDETGGGEYYLDSLGVVPHYQGKGVGGKLLRFLIEEYVEKKELTLGLLVDKENPGAKRLYLKAGFEVVGEKVLAGKRLEHLQICPFSTKS